MFYKFNQNLKTFFFNFFNFWNLTESLFLVPKKNTNNYEKRRENILYYKKLKIKHEIVTKRSLK